MNAADRVRDALNLRARRLSSSAIDQHYSGLTTAANIIKSKIGRAFDALRK